MFFDIPENFAISLNSNIIYFKLLFNICAENCINGTYCYNKLKVYYLIKIYIEFFIINLKHAIYHGII